MKMSRKYQNGNIIGAMIVVAVIGIVGAVAMPLLFGQKVEVPSASVGKVMGKNGYREGTIPTSKFRLDPCLAYCDKLVTLDVSDVAITEKMKLFMPQDKLNMHFDVRLTLAVNPKKYEEIFRLIPPEQTENGDKIPLSRVYQTYAQQIVRAEAREFLSEYTIAEIASSRESINTELSVRLSESIQNQTPFMVRYAGLADVQYPEIIVTAQENAAERREQIQQEEAQLEISKVTLERQLQEQRMQRAIDVERAEAEAQVNKILADSITPEYIKYRELTALENLSRNTSTKWVPTEMLSGLSGDVAAGNLVAQ